MKKILLIKELLDEGFTLDASVKKVEERIKKLEEAFKEIKEKTQTN